MAELVERTGVAAATVRYYLASGLLPPPRRAKANRFFYDERHVEVIRLIRLLQDRRNLSLEVIGRMLPDLLPDLTGSGEGGAFRPEMWGQLLAAHFPSTSLPSPSDRLLEAGVAAFARHGYADVSVDDVCRAAGLAKGSFYRHFSSKEELFFAGVFRVGETVLEVLSPAQEGRSAVELTQSIAAAFAPYVAIILDLISLASHRRPGYGRALRRLIAQISAGLSVEVSKQDAASLEGVQLVQRALVEAVHMTISDVLTTNSLEQLHEDPQAS